MVYTNPHFPPVPDFPTDTNAWSFLLNHPLGLPAPLPDHVMFVDGLTGFKRTRYEFLERVELAAAALTTSRGGLGLKPTDVVAVLSENCLDYVTLINALLSQAVPFALLSAHVTQRELKHCLKTSQANHVFVHANLLPVALSACNEFGIPKNHVYILEGNAPHGFRSFNDMVTTAKKQIEPSVGIKQVKKDTLAYLLFSSGTTGLPKAVMISHWNIVYSTIQFYVWVGTLQQSAAAPPRENVMPVVLSFLPFYHTYGLHSFILRSVCSLGTYIILPRWSLSLALKLIPKYKVTMVPAVPPVVHQLANSPQVTKEHLKSVTAVLSGAAYLPPSVGNALIAKTGGALEVLHGYGLTEATVAAIACPKPGIFPPPFPQEKLPFNTAGTLAPGMGACIVREDGTEAADGETGELWLTGGNIAGNIALGYWGNPEATAETFFKDEKGRRWLKTGDCFKVDKAGFFFFEDRMKDTLKVNGMQVSPAEIEVALLDHPDRLIIDAAVAGVTPKGMGGQDTKVPRAWVILSPHGRKTGKKKVAEELEAWTKKTLSKYKWLKGGIAFVDEIPKSINGKVLRRTLVDEYEKKHKGERAKL